MNNKIKKYCVFTLLCLCVGFVAGISNNLKIFKNVDDTVVEVSSQIEVPSGANLMLICQIENINNKGIINGYATWFISSKIHSEVKLRTLKNSSNLVFRNVNSNDEGLYVCASLKYNIFKTMNLLLKHSESAKHSYLNIPRLTKRDIIPGNGPYVFNDTDPFVYNLNLEEMQKNLEKMREDLFRELDNEKKIKDLELYNNDNNYDMSFNNRKDSSTDSFSVNPVVLFFGVLFAVFVIFLLVCLCLFMSRNLSQRNRNNRQQNIYNAGVTVPRSNRCGHASCSSGACRFHHNSLSTTTVINNVIDIEEPLIHNPLSLTTQLDLPPTYSSSTHNSTQNLNEATNRFDKTKLDAVNSNNLNLPPSYDEAIRHKDDNHIATATHNHNGNRSSGHDHGMDNNGHVHHSTPDGISGNDASGGGGSND